MTDFITRLPKAELHIHIEGTLEPELMFALAGRNEHRLPFEDVDQIKKAYSFRNLQDFLDIYYQGAAVLQTPDCFYDLMTAYLDRAAADGVRRAEVFFDPQTHTERGIGYPVFMGGFTEAIADAKKRTGISVDLILCFLRHLSPADALDTLSEAEDHLEGVIAVGLDSSEKGRPPQLFTEAYRRARELGLRAVAHAGEEGPPSYVSAALDDLGVERIDHGVRSMEDPELVARLATEQVPLTVCPFSNVALQVVPDLESHPLPQMMEAGLNVSIHSDDPAYFGGYVGANYVGVSRSLGLTDSEMADLAANSIRSTFLSDPEKTVLLDEIKMLRSDVSG